MKAGKLYCFSIFQMVGLGMQLWNWKAGGIVILGGCMGQIIYISREILNKRKLKTCPKCNASMQRQLRLCPECGYQYKKGPNEEELMDYIEQEREEADTMTSAEIDYNFEKVEEYVIDEVASFDGDIQEFLDRRERGEHTARRVEK